MFADVWALFDPALGPMRMSRMFSASGKFYIFKLDDTSEVCSFWQRSDPARKINIGDLLTFSGSCLWNICLKNSFKSSGELFGSVLV